MALVSHRFTFAITAVLCAGLGTRAGAQPAPPPGPPASGGPAIAPPAADAPPDKVEDARDTAKAAALTPLVPNPRDATRPAFQLYAEIDLPVLVVGLVFVGSRFVRTQKAFCAPRCSVGDLNALDRATAGIWSPGWGLASNSALFGLGGAAAAMLVVDEGLLAAVNDLVVISEAALSATGAATIMTIAAGRPRPFLYGNEAPFDERNSVDGGNSFLSSHAAVGFAVATSTYVAVRRLHPTSKLQYGVLGAGLGTAAFVATSRVLAGKHFITDAVGGALVGSALGILVASVHRSPVAIVPVVGDAQHGVGIQGSF
jgi:membrane-associated phospholipid phosphatase